MKIAVGSSRNTKQWTNKEITFDEIRERLATPFRTVETVEEYAKMPKKERDEIKDKGGFVAGYLKEGARKLENLTCRSMWTADLDHATPEFVAGIKFRAVVYSTHSHTPENPRLRLIVPFTRDVTVDEYVAVSRYLAADIGIEMFDECSFRPNQLMYWPSCPSDGEYFYKDIDGPILNPDDVLKAHPDWKDCSQLPTTSREGTLKKYASQKQEDPLKKVGIVGAFCRTYGISDVIEKYLSDVYKPTTIDGRYTYIPGESAAGLIVYDEDRFAYSHHATDPACGQLLNAFDLVRVHKCEGDFKKACALAVADEDVKRRIIRERGADFEQSLQPEDFTDVGQAVVMTTEYVGKLSYSGPTGFLVYNGSFWEESRLKAQKLAQELTTRQLVEANVEVEATSMIMKEKGVWELLAAAPSKKKALVAMSPIELQVYEDYENAKKYKEFVLKHRDSRYITAVLREVQPLLEIDWHSLDVNEFLLNTPTATYDLRTGERKDHDPMDSITKQTRVDPDDKGMDIWLKAVDTFFPGDKQLQNYVQETVGLAAIGRVYQEALVIAYGDGRNGKSTFWNTIARVLGSYSGTLSADTLTVNKYRNVKPELAEARGKRLLIAAELEEGTQLSTAIVKQLCSTDEVNAEKKYKDPFAFIPTHMVVLCTNHLPKVEALDEGTWRKLVVIPFNARIEGKSDIKNYSDYLLKNCGGAVLSWIMEGAKRVIAKDHKLNVPPAVEAASRGYRETNDWLTPFLEECCELDPSYEEKSGQVYQAYYSRCRRIGERAHNAPDLAAALERAGIGKYRTGKGRMLKGLRLISTAEEEFVPF